MIKLSNEGEVVSTLTNKSNVTSSPIDLKIKEKYTMSQQQLFNKIAELAAMYKLAKEPSVADKAVSKAMTEANAKQHTPGYGNVILPTQEITADRLPAQATKSWGKGTYSDYSSSGSFGKAFAAARAKGEKNFYYRDATTGKENIFGTQVAKSKGEVLAEKSQVAQKAGAPIAALPKRDNTTSYKATPVTGNKIESKTQKDMATAGQQASKDISAVFSQHMQRS